MLDSLLLSIESRGRDATGFVAISDEMDNEWHKASCEAKTFCAYRRFVPEKARVVIGHTRWATQGLPEFVENNHPIKRGPYFIIHNGHVNNDDELFASAKRWPYGRVDSEAIAARLSSMDDLARLGEVMEEIDGDAAVAAVDERDPSKLVLARGRSSPLWVYSGRVIVIFASTKDAVEKAHKDHVGHLSDARLFEMKEGEQYLWDGDALHRNEFKFKTKTYSWSNPANQTTYQKPNHVSTLADDEEEWGSFLGGGFDQNCDGCDMPIYWRDVVYRYDSKSEFTNGFCDDCAELWDWGKIQEMVDEGGDDPLHDDGGICKDPGCWNATSEGYGLCVEHRIDQLALNPAPSVNEFFDDFDNANESILKQGWRGLFGI